VNPAHGYNGRLARLCDRCAQLVGAASSSLAKVQDRTVRETAVDGAYSAPGLGSMTDVRSYISTITCMQFQFFEWESIGTPERSWWLYFEDEVPKLAEMGVTIVWLPRECAPPKGASAIHRIID
jgi:hypothetical protein